MMTISLISFDLRRDFVDLSSLSEKSANGYLENPPIEKCPAVIKGSRKKEGVKVVPLRFKALMALPKKEKKLFFCDFLELGIKAEEDDNFNAGYP